VTFASPLALIALAAVPVALVGYVLAERRRARLAQRFATAAMLPNLVARRPGWRRHLPTALLLLGLAALLVGVARPSARVSTKQENATVVLAIDTSRSMSAVDTHPSRLAAAKETALRFLDQLPERYRVAVVAFATKAEIVAPATHDHSLAARALSGLTPIGGTALADGISLALDAGRAGVRPGEAAAGSPAQPAPVSVVVFTDGLQEGGRVTAAEATSRAVSLHIPIFTVAVGTPYGIVRVPRVGGFVQFIRVPVDPAELQVMSRQTGGRSWVGPRSADLTAVYEDLKSRLVTTRKRAEVTVAFAIAGLGFMLIGGTLSATWLKRVP
jgi:Ca-activated chloride channel family protein